jgi:hypothetical protein
MKGKKYNAIFHVISSRDLQATPSFRCSVGEAWEPALAGDSSLLGTALPFGVRISHDEGATELLRFQLIIGGLYAPARNI